ncbi:MAG TPA: D-2-hydroxyacid dehydrogenase [Dehalococcoidia bacterium]|nr:D-2-hydroxyacid dehydrogenase [Dehalococcoidia bacterium]
MKVLIQLRALTLPEVTEEELAQIREAAGAGAQVVVASNDEESAEHLPDAEVILGLVDPRTFAQAKQLRWVHAVVSGIDVMLFPELVESDVVVTGEKALVGEHLADHAFALLLALTRQIKRAVLEAPDSWPSRLAMRRQMIELSGLTMGIVGLGGTGRAVARRARAFGMDVLAADAEVLDRPQEVRELWRMDRFHDLLRASDVVTICCPLTDATRGLFDDSAFAAMRRGSYLVNVTRGPIVVAEALVRALREGRLAGAGLDVTPLEPLPPDHPLWSMPNVVITPHTAGASQMRGHRNVQRFIENLRRFRAGEPLEGLVDKRKGY